MAATEDISFRVALDDGQAQAGLEGLRTKATGVAAAADGAAGGIGGITKTAGKLNSVVGPAATAITGLSGAIGGVSSSAGSAVGAVGSLASALASGGKLAGGIAVIGLAVGALVQKYNDMGKAAEEAAKKQKDLINKIIQAGLGPLEAATLRLNQANKDLQIQQMLTGGTTDEVILATRDLVLEMETLQFQMQNNGTEMSRIEKIFQSGMESGKVLSAERRKELSEEYKAMEAQQSLLRQTYNITAETISQTAKSTEISIDRRDRLKQEADAIRDAEKAEKDRLDQQKKYAKEMEEFQGKAGVDFVKNFFKAEIDARKQAEEDARRTWEEVGPTREMLNQEEMRQFKIKEDAKTAYQKKQKEDRERLAKEEAEEQKKRIQETASIAKDLTSVLIGATSGLFDEMITGQEMAMERFIVNVMRQAGSFMIGKGLELGALGLANALSGNPILQAQSAAQIGGAAALIGSGMTIGGVATGIEHTVIGGGRLGQSLEQDTASKKATTSTPMGAGRISIGGVGDGGPGGPQTHTYVFNAPVFGDQNRSAKHVALLQRRARRDLLMA